LSSLLFHILDGTAFSRYAVMVVCRYPDFRRRFENVRARKSALRISPAEAVAYDFFLY
jgi:hypothetical protein